MPIADGHRQALADIAELCDEGRKDFREARHTRVPQQQALIHASLDAERLLERLGDMARRLRR